MIATSGRVALIARSAVLVLGALSTLILAGIVIGSTFFRPVQDDYAFAADGVRLGALGGAWDYYLRLNGGLTQSVYDYGIGQVVGSLPWAWAYVPFTAAFLLLVVLVCGQAISLVAPGLPRLTRFALAPAAALAVFFSLGSLTGAMSQDLLYTQFAWFAGANRGVFIWILLSLILLWLRRGALVPGRWWPLSALIGMVLGLWNMPEALVVAMLCGVALLAKWFFRSTLPGRVTELLALAGGAAAGGLINYFSPGSVNRKELLEDRGLLENLRRVPGTFESLWAGSFGNAGLLLVIVLAAGVGTLIALGWTRPSPAPGSGSSSSAPLRKLLWVLVVLIAIQLIVVPVAGAFAYFDVYHGYGVMHLLAVTTVFAVAGLAARTAHHTRTPLLILICALALVLAAVLSEGFILRELLLAAQWRRDIWETGEPVSFGFFYDRDPGGWVVEDWLRLRAVRDQAGLD